MKVKTSITLSEDLLKAIDEYVGEYKNRSEFIEDAIRSFIIHLIRRQQDARDLEIINQHADYLNREAADVLTYQVDGELLSGRSLHRKLKNSIGL